MCCWNVATYELKVHKGKIEIIFLQKNKASFSTDPHMHCKLLGVSSLFSNGETRCLTTKRHERNMMFVCLMVFNATFNNFSVVSWRSVLLVEGIGVPLENHRHVANHWQTLLHNVVSSTPRHEWGSNSSSLLLSFDSFYSIALIWCWCCISLTTLSIFSLISSFLCIYDKYII
jgi:hypothetical protein